MKFFKFPSGRLSHLHILSFSFIIAAGFYLGFILKTAYLPHNTEIVELKSFSALIQAATAKNLELKTDKATFTVSPDTLAGWVEAYKREYSGQRDLRLSNSMIENYLQSLAPRINVDPVNAKFTFKDNKAQVFVAPINGKELDIHQSAGNIMTAIMAEKGFAQLAINNIDPEITLEKVNDLGITTLLGRGESDYGRSPMARIHNIKVGMSKFNGIILNPGEEFSFNKILGSVEEADGYQPELVIKDGRLIKEYGGGLCQVSTTVFRAAILSGLPIIERHPHFFPVHYYNPQGFDSTIYPGVVDLKFVNNTPAHILIQTKLTGSKLNVEVYGSDDGRVVKMDGPYQYAQKANGALKAYFTRTIAYGDKTETQRFDSNYSPPPKSPLVKNPLE